MATLALKLPRVLPPQPGSGWLAQQDVALLPTGPPPTAPTISTQPVSVTVTGPATATFTAIGASHGGSGLAWKWQRSTDGGATWPDLGGATGSGTSASYTTPATTSAVSGTEYRAVFTDSAGSVTSSAAILTVLPGIGDLFPALTLLVDWTNTGTYVDESAYLREFQFSRGRAAVNDVFAAGTASVRLRNESGRFGPFNPGSALTGDVIGGRPLKLSALYQGVTYPLWAGFTTEYTETELLPLPETTLSCIDAFDGFSRNKASIALQTGQTTDALITLVLAAAGWTGGTTLDAGRTLPFYAQISKSVLQALQEVAQNELGGAVFMGKDGSVVFQNAGHRAAETSSFTLNGGIEQMQLGLRQSDLIDRVRVTYGSYTLLTAVQGIYSGNVNRQLPAQQYTTFSDTMTSAQVGSVVTPQPYTDYTASDGTQFISTTDGGNLDVTDSVWLETFTVSGGAFTATFYNSLPYTVQLTGFAIRGTGLQSVSNPPVYEADVVSPVVTNQSLEISAAFVTDITAITAFATARANALGTQHPRPVITVVGRTPALMAFLLGCDLSQRITLVDNAGPWQSGIGGDFFIEHVQLSIAPGQIPTAQLTLFDLSQGSPA